MYSHGCEDSNRKIHLAQKPIILLSSQRVNRCYRSKVLSQFKPDPGQFTLHRRFEQTQYDSPQSVNIVKQYSASVLLAVE